LELPGTTSIKGKGLKRSRVAEARPTRPRQVPGSLFVGRPRRATISYDNTHQFGRRFRIHLCTIDVRRAGAD
jgi:hypothetical protein